MLATNMWVCMEFHWADNLPRFNFDMRQECKVWKTGAKLTCKNS